nr:GntR family transcriptional regulator [Dictyobacter kobayashii]
MSRQMEEKFSALREIVARMAGQRLPGERELAAQLQVSRPTLRAWLDILEQEGSIQRRQGSGTYAVDIHAEPALRSISLLIDASLKLGDDPFVSLLVDQLLASLQAEHMQCSIERIASDSQVQLRLRDGAILIGQAGQALIQRISAFDLPVVSLLLTSELASHPRVSILQTADREAGAEAAAYLLRAACQQLIFVGKQEVSSSWERWLGRSRPHSRRGSRSHFAPVRSTIMRACRWVAHWQIRRRAPGAESLSPTTGWPWVCAPVCWAEASP